MQKFSIRDEIVEVINKLFVYTDEKDWPRLQHEVFSPAVSFDMSSVGGEKMETTSVNICATWNKGFENIDAINHLAGNYIIEINDNTAIAFAYATATHYKASATKGTTREFVGTYNIGLIKKEVGWRIHSFRYNLKYATGNTDLS